jgi:signal transduction histidine kinase
MGLRPSLDLVGPIDSAVPADLRPDVLAVLREALSNVVRHAMASDVRVSIGVDGGRLTIMVSDDGVGVPEDATRSGLENLLGRARRRGGSFEVRPNTPRGTLVDWSVPI